jgi:hypothetical protein
MKVKFKYNEKLLVELIYANREMYGGITTHTAQIAWAMVSNIINRGVRIFRKTENYLLNKSFLTNQDIENDLFENVVCDLLVKYDRNKGSFRYYLNNAVNYRVLRIVNQKDKQNISIPIQTPLHSDNNGSGNENLTVYDDAKINDSRDSYDFLVFDLKNCGFTDNEINIVRDIIAGYDISNDCNAICNRNNITKMELAEVKEKIKKVYS